MSNLKDYDFIVGFTLFTPKGFKTMYRHFDKLETAKLFASNVNIKNNSKIYVDLEFHDLIQMVDLLIQAKRINYEETKDYEIESLKFKNEGLSKQINNYRYFPDRLKEEIYKLEDFINTFKFIDNTECYAYEVAMEKLNLLKQIYYKY